jgi:hypothetical protein
MSVILAFPNYPSIGIIIIGDMLNPMAPVNQPTISSANQSLRNAIQEECFPARAYVRRSAPQRRTDTILDFPGMHFPLLLC